MVIEPLADEFHYLRLPRFDGSRLHDSLRNGGGSENARIVMARRDDVRLQMLLLPEYEHAISLGRLDCHTLASYHFARNCVRLANSLGLRSESLAAAHLHKLRYHLPIIGEGRPVGKSGAREFKVVIVAILVCYDNGIAPLRQ